MIHDRYSSTLAERYAAAAMLTLWSPQTRQRLGGRLWPARLTRSEADVVRILLAARARLTALVARRTELAAVRAGAQHESEPALRAPPALHRQFCDEFPSIAALDR